MNMSEQSEDLDNQIRKGNEELEEQRRENRQWIKAFCTTCHIFLIIGIMVGLGIGIVYGVLKIIVEPYQEYKEYQNFCEERPMFCYCNLWEGGCEFKTSWSSVSGLSNDTKELCELAAKLKDKETIFRVGCNE